MKPLLSWYLIAGGILVFLWFSLLLLGYLKIPELDTLKQMYNGASTSSVNWTHVDLYSSPIPEESHKRIQNVTIETGSVKVENVNLFFRKATPADGLPQSGQSLLFLHGKSFNSETWEKLGTLKLMAALGHVAVAVDLPGYGNTRERYSGNRADFLLSFMKAVSLSEAKPVLVSPSMSGEYSVPFISKYSDRLSGYIPVAPVATGKATKDKLKRIQLPTLIVSGEHDYTMLAEQALSNLGVMPNSRNVRLANARHAAYMDQPEIFHEILYNFMKLLKNT